MIVTVSDKLASTCLRRPAFNRGFGFKSPLLIKPKAMIKKALGGLGTRLYQCSAQAHNLPCLQRCEKFFSTAYFSTRLYCVGRDPLSHHKVVR